MKRKKISIYLLLGLFVFSLSSNTDSTDVIYWTEGYKLDWEDFQGAPRYDYEMISALTSSGIVHYKGCKDGKIIYKVQAYFEKKESWVKEEALTDHHLTHEQIHFDITELAARKLRKALAERQFKCGEEEWFESFVSKFIDNWRNDQKNFDIMSKHSLDKEQQEKWFHRVEDQLKELDEYK